MNSIENQWFRKKKSGGGSFQGYEGSIGKDWLKNKNVTG